MKKSIKKLYAAGGGASGLGGLGGGSASSGDLIGEATKLLNPSTLINAPINMAKGVKNTADNALDAATMGADENGDMKTEKDLKPLNDLDLAERNARAALLSSGVDEHTADQMANSLVSGKSGAFTRLSAYQFLTKAVSIIAPSGISIARVFPMLGPLMMNRNYQIDQVLAILSVIGKYASEYPGLGIWDMAVAVAKGESVDKQLTLVRFLMTGKDNKYNMGASSDLVQAMMAIGIPGTDLTKVINTYERMHQKTLQLKEQIGIDFAIVNAQWATEAHKKMQSLYTELLKKFPEWQHSPLFEQYMHAAYALTSASAIVKAVTDAGLFRPVSGVPTSIEEGTPKRAASPAVEAARRVIAQSAPPASIPPYTAPNGVQLGINQIGPNTNQAASTGIDTLNGNPSKADKSMNANASSAQKLVDDTTQLGASLTATENTYNELQELTGSLMSAKDGEDDVPFASEQTLEQVGKQLLGVTQQGMALARELLKKFNQMRSAAITKDDMKALMEYFKLTNPSALGAAIQERIAGLSNTLAKWRQRYALAILFGATRVPLMNIKRAQQTYDNYKQNYEFARDQSGGFYSSDYGMPLQKICMYMAAQYDEVLANVRNILSTTPPTDVDMTNFFQTQAKVYEKKSQQKKLEARSIGIEMAGGIFGRQVATNPGMSMLTAGADSKFVRVADDNIKEATSVQEEWNLIYKGTDVGGYGNILEHPEKYRDVPTEDVKPSGAKKKKFKKIKLSDIVC